MTSDKIVGYISLKRRDVTTGVTGTTTVAPKFSVIYRKRAIITRSLYTFYPLFEVHLCTVTFGLMYGLSLRAACNQERPMMTHVRYVHY